MTVSRFIEIMEARDSTWPHSISILRELEIFYFSIQAFMCWEIDIILLLFQFIHIFNSSLYCEMDTCNYRNNRADVRSPLKLQKVFFQWSRLNCCSVTSILGNCITTFKLCYRSDRKVIKTTFPGNFRLHNDIPIAGIWTEKRSSTVKFSKLRRSYAR